jgi:hypothetical protein
LVLFLLAISTFCRLLFFTMKKDRKQGGWPGMFATPGRQRDQFRSMIFRVQ